MDVWRAERECGSAVSGLGLISHHPHRVCIPFLSSGRSTSYRYAFISFLLLFPYILCPLPFHTSICISVHSVTNLLSGLCPQSFSTTHNTSNRPTRFPKCDHHCLVFSCFLSPLRATIVLIAFSCAPHQIYSGYTAIFFIFNNRCDRIYTLCKIMFVFL